jgi:hypothetical protein
VAQLVYSYGRFRSTDERWQKSGHGHDVSWRPTELIDHLIGLRPEPGYLASLLLWPAHDIAAAWDAAGQPDSGRWANLSMDEFARWLAVDPALSSTGLGAVLGGRDPDPGFLEALDVTSVLFTEGAETAATEGRLTEALAPHLARVRRIDRLGTVEVPDIRAFGAWCLNRLLDSRRQFSLRTCELCGLPWLAVREAGRYCSRPAPGHRSSCRAVAAQERYTASHADYSAERRRLGQLARRGRLGKREYAAWKQDNGPGAEGREWRRYDDWKQRRKEK